MRRRRRGLGSIESQHAVYAKDLLKKYGNNTVMCGGPAIILMRVAGMAWADAQESGDKALQRKALKFLQRVQKGTETCMKCSEGRVVR